MSDYLKKILILFSGNSLAFVIQLAVAPILTRLYNPEDFGAFANVMAICGILAILGGLRFEQAIIKSAENNKESLLSALTIRVSLILFVILALVLLLFGDQLIAGFDLESINLLSLAWILGVFTLWFGVFGNLVLSRGKFRRLSSAKVVYAALVAVLSILFHYYPVGVNGLVIATTIAFPIAALIFYRDIAEVIRASKALPASSLMKEYAEYPKWNLPLAIADSLNQQFLFNLLFTVLFGLEAMGLYAITWRYLKAPIRLLQSSISSVFYREAVNSPTEAYSFFKSTIRQSGLLIAPLILVVLLYGPELFAFALGEEWYEAGRIARCIIPMVAVGLISGSVSAVPLLVEAQKKFTIMSISFQSIGLMILWGVAKFLGMDMYDSVLIYGLVNVLFYLVYLLWFSGLLKSFRAL